MRNIDVCIYHYSRPAIKKCPDCQVPLCKYEKDYCHDHEKKSNRGVYNFKKL